MPLDDNQTAALSRAAVTIGEHFGAVLILASIESGGGTEMYSHVIGNYYACKGMASAWSENMADQDAGINTSDRGEGDEDD